MEETKEALNSMIINSDNPAAALDDAIGAIWKSHWWLCTIKKYF